MVFVGVGVGWGCCKGVGGMPKREGCLMAFFLLFNILSGKANTAFSQGIAT